MNAVRCGWANSSAEYLAYHDDEWGRPVRDDVQLFERLSLEAFQSGLSWITVLRKRDAFREVFAGFDPEAVAGFGDSRIVELLADSRIIRHRGKIEATIRNAQSLLGRWDQNGTEWLTSTLLEYAPSEASLRRQGFSRPPRQLSDLPARCEETAQLAKHLKRQGFVFLGPTTLYAALQATGFVQDHVSECHRYGG
jgi:DNA-3-methyladenine glycosylase I